MHTLSEGSGKSHIEFSENLACYLILDLEDISQIPFISLRPEMVIIVSSYQLSGNPYSLAGFPDTPLQNMCDVQKSGDRSYVLAFDSVTERGCTCLNSRLPITPLSMKYRVLYRNLSNSSMARTSRGALDTYGR